jgi:8-oxo-dGTP pyrophosphatase MutT (NUDIX family)
MFLLGQEHACSGWRDSQKWSEFGGRAQNKLESPEDIASREFYEETAGVIYDKCEIRDLLLNKRYIKFYDYQIGENKFYRTYLVKIPYKDYCENFARTYLYLLSRQLDAKRILEKRELRWISFSQLKAAVENEPGKYSRPLQLRERFKNWISLNLDDIAKAIGFLC